ncbi:MAG: class I SAM-dependent methyltransferase [Chloroflexi bacterium]|nr:class I SAM-dependent methyltransferase [Chloroflexota bacterium]
MLPPEKHVQPLRLHEALGGLVHPGIDLAEGAYVLDVGREVGDWTGELAQCYPQHHIVRVQTSATAVQGVAGTGRKQWANVTYASVQDVLQLEDTFAPESFDLICVHFCASEVPLQQFPALMQSLLRLCKEQGHVVWLETDLPVTCDDACDRLAWLLIAALRARGAMVACLSVPQVGLAAWMEQWLRDAGCNIVQDSFYRAFVSAGKPLHGLFVQQMHYFSPHLYSFLLHMQVARAQVLDELFAQARQEMQHKDFFAFCSLCRFVCVKPSLWQSRRWWSKR